MSKLLTKYKERNPEETIKIIGDFFKSRGFEIYEEHFDGCEIDTYSCHYQLFFNKKVVLESSGKGTDKTYAKASGYSEMYERFCAFPIMCYNQLNYYNYQKENLKKHGYHLAKDEKKLTIDDILNNACMRGGMQLNVPNLNKDLIDKTLKIMFNDEIYGRAYNSINTNEKTYINSMLVGILYGSNGLAAGNTIEEALVQGTSELYERFAFEQYMVNMQNKFYYIKKSNLPIQIQTYINKLEEKGLESRIYDLSYNFNVPAAMLLIIDKNRHTFYKNIGAHPIFDIACERTFTEIHQGVYEVNKLPLKIKINQSNVESIDITDACSHAEYSNEPLIESLILNSIEINEYNKNIFLEPKEYDNIDLLNQIKKINNIIKMDFYYTNLSLCENMCAVHIVPNKLFGLGKALEIQAEIERSKNMIDYYKQYDIWLDINEMFNNLIINKQQFSNEYINNFINNILDNIRNLGKMDQAEYLAGISEFFIYDISEPMLCDMITKGYDRSLVFIYLLGMFENLSFNLDTEFAANLIKWNLLYQYCIKYNYDLNTFNKILDFLGYDKIDININDFNPIEYIRKSLLENLQSLYNNKEYYDFIKSVII